MDGSWKEEWEQCSRFHCSKDARYIVAGTILCRRCAGNYAIQILERDGLARDLLQITRETNERINTQR